MRIGDRYLGLDVLFFAIVGLVFLSVLIVHLISGAPKSEWLIFGGGSFGCAYFVVAIAITTPGCPYCRKFLTGKKLGSERIGDDKEKVTYSCVSCGKEWTEEIDTSFDYEPPW